MGPDRLRSISLADGGSTDSADMPAKPAKAHRLKITMKQPLSWRNAISLLNCLSADRGSKHACEASAERHVNAVSSTFKDIGGVSL